MVDMACGRGGKRIEYKNKSVLCRTTAAPRQFANSCKHDLPLRSACTFFDKLGNGKIIEEKSSFFVDFRNFALPLHQHSKRRNGYHIQREVFADDVPYRTNRQEDVSDVQELLRYNSLNYEKLKGDKAGLSSVRVNDQYRIEFEEQMREGETIATICRIIDLSNHYNNR